VHDPALHVYSDCRAHRYALFAPKPPSPPRARTPPIDRALRVCALVRPAHDTAAAAAVV
jgi:hypothetical protein